MRILRLKIDKNVVYKLRLIAREFKVDESFVIDLYALMRLKGNGLPSDARQQKLIDRLVKGKTMTKLSAKIHVKKRVHTFKSLTKLAYFTACSRLANPLYAIEKLLKQFFKIGAKVRQSQCESCTLKANCDFGKQYETLVSDITKVIDPDFSKKAHVDCPHLPDIDATNQLNEALKAMHTLMNPANKAQNQAVASQLEKDKARQGIKDEETEDEEGDRIPSEFGQAADELDKMHEDSEPEKREEDDELDESLDDEDFAAQTVGGFTKDKAASSFTADYYVKVQERMIDQMLKSGLDLLELGQVLDSLLNRTGGVDFKPTDEIGKEHKQRNLVRTSDISQADKVELAHDDDIVDAKVARKSLKIEKDHNPTKKRQLLYVSIDVSASMRTQFYPNRNSVFSRASLATVFASSLVKKVMNDNGIMYLRFFQYSVSRLHALNTKEDFEDMMKTIRDCDFNGSGTSIGNALAVALSDIEAIKSELSKSTLLMITDADDLLSLQPAQITDLKSREFAVLDVSGTKTTNPYYSNRADTADKVLKTVAKKYYKCDQDSMDPKKLISLL